MDQDIKVPSVTSQTSNIPLQYGSHYDFCLVEIFLLLRSPAGFVIGDVTGALLVPFLFSSTFFGFGSWFGTYEGPFVGLLVQQWIRRLIQCSTVITWSIFSSKSPQSCFSAATPTMGPFHQRFFKPQFKFAGKFVYWCISISVNRFFTDFCTCHDSIDFLSCVTFRSDPSYGMD